ncbi:MAG: hypothetical protein U9N57_10410 [Pseudomonadota bacterium]|nr:hypothetical protein [Pseudomonadota bacterium]
MADDEKQAKKNLEDKSALINGNSIPEFVEKRLLDFVNEFIKNS